MKLETWTLDDGPELARICSAVDRSNLSDRIPYPYTLAHARDWLTMVGQREGRDALYRKIVLDGQVVGNISVEAGEGISRRTGEIGYFLLSDCHGRGIMSRAAGQICALAFQELGLHRISGFAYARNLPSRRVLEKNGFILEGIMRGAVLKDGEFLDYAIYGKLTGDPGGA
ncbi:MAG: GNAT family protein [Tissierellia bacterium]|nr:GNAT family protein [Tissierellia bacterium]